jgi:hypothetical protein
MSPNRSGVHYGYCEQCKRPISHVATCPVCGRSCCRWGCYAHHVARHLTPHREQPGESREAVQDDRGVS